MSEVVIVGAGPVGLTLAIELTRYGVPVRIVDQAPGRSTTSKALVIWSRTLELLARSGCADELLHEGTHVTGARISAGTEAIGRITFEHVATPYPFALMLPQSDTERILEQHLNAQGVQVERNVELANFVRDPDGVTLRLRHPGGREEQARTPWLAGTDGAHSTVRHQLDLAYAGDTLESGWVLADVHLSGMQTPPDEIDLIWHEDGMLALFPIREDRYRVIADVGQTEQPDPTLQQVQDLIDRRGPGGIRAADPVWLAAFRINERKVREYRTGRTFLAGDAAHIHSPAGGQGMNTGMHDACNLAWKLACVVQGTCHESLLNSYSAERSPVGDQILSATGRLTAVAVTKSVPLQFVRNQFAHAVLGLSAVRDAAAANLTEVSIGYPHSSLSRQIGSAHDGASAGSRAPIRNGETPVGADRTPRFVLCAAPGAEATRFVERNTALVDARVRPPYREGGLWLVRPDAYVGLAAPGDAWDDAQRYLDEVAGVPA